MATADYWSSADLKALTAGGLINEDVMQKIWDISQIPLPFTDAVGSGEKADNAYTEWTLDALQAPDTTNAVVDGADALGNQAAGGTRVGNHCQQSDKVVAVTYRANASDVIGRSNELAYQLMMRQQELRRDLEAIALLPQASVADNGDATAGKVGTFPAWLITNDSNGAGGSATGFNTTTKVVAIPVAGTTRVLTIAILKDIIELVYLSNGNPSILMAVPQVIRRLNAFIIANPTSTGIATPTANVSGTGAGVEQTAQGYVNVIVTDFGFTLKLVPNRLQPTYTDAGVATTSDVFLIDTAMVHFAYLIGYRADPLAKLGTAERRQMLVDWTLRVPQEKAHGIIRHVTPTGTITA